MKVHNKICVVTGGLSGLGLATVLRLLASGAYVAVLDLSSVSTFEDYGPERVKIFRTDVSDTTQVGRSVAGILEWSNSAKLDIGAIVCCAGFLGPAKIISKDGEPMSLETFAKVLSVSLTGTVDVIRGILPRICSQEADADGERAVIITVSSAAAFDGQPGQVAYSAAKGAISSMTLPMARDLAPKGIRVMCIAPGMFETTMTSGMPRKARDSLQRVLEFPQRAGQPDEFASMVEYIFSNAMLNGSVIRLDGATRMPSRL